MTVRSRRPRAKRGVNRCQIGGCRLDRAKPLEENLYEGAGHAVREFILKDGHGRVDYLLFVYQTPIGTIEAKLAGTTLTEVEFQSLMYSKGLPDGFASRFERLPFAFESTGMETRVTNGLGPGPRSR